MQVEDIPTQPFFKALASEGEVFFVGGFVRDLILHRDSKDIDLLVRKLSYERIVEILNPFVSNIDVVGRSFGTVKFRVPEFPFEFDVVLPRKDKVGFDKTHNAIIAECDPEISVEADLERRDLTINSIAMNSEGEFIDPFHGISDIEQRVIRATSIASFSDDPLRMLRAIVAASRFNFRIVPETWDLILANAKDMQFIKGQRILEEFEKIVLKGNPSEAAELLIDSKLFEHIFGVKFGGDMADFLHVRSVADFGFALLKKHFLPHKMFKRVTDKEEILKHIEGLEIARTSTCDVRIVNRHTCNRVFKISPSAFESLLVPHKFQIERFYFLRGDFPISLKQLAINGDMLIDECGMKEGKDVGITISKALDAVYEEKVKNDKEALYEFLNLHVQHGNNS